MMPMASVEELENLLAEIVANDEKLPAARTRDDGTVLRRVIQSADDPDPDVRLKACWVVSAWLKHREESDEDTLSRAAVDTIVRLMRNDPKAKVRWGAVLCSQALRPTPFPHLLAATKDRSCTVRYYVAFALSCYIAGYFQGAREQYRPIIIEGLLRLIADKDEQVREWAALGFGLGGHDTPETRERLWQALDDRIPDVAGAAASSLVFFRDPGIRAGIVRLLEADDLAPNVFDATRKLGDPTLLPLVKVASARFERMLEADPGRNPVRWDLSAIEALSAPARQTEG